MVTLPPGLTTETGYATNYGSLSGWPVDPAEHVPELIYPLSIQVYDRMRRGDDQIKAVLNAITLPILQAKWWIDPNGAAPHVVQHIASDLNLPIKGEPDTPNQKRRKNVFSWKKHLREALLHLSYGHMPFEMICDTDRGDGLAHLNRLSPRMPVTIGRIETNRSGQLSAAYQYPTILPDKTGLIANATMPELDKDTGMVKIDGDRLVWYVNELEGASWQGNSIFRAAYGLWALKIRALRANAMKDERNGMGIPKYTGAPSEQDLTSGKNMANQLRGGESAGVAIPNGASLELMGVTGTLPDILASLGFYNEGIARIMMTQFLNLGTTKTGSRALGDSFIDFFKLSMDAITGDVADTGNADVVEPIVTWNYGEDEQCPLLVCDEVDLETDLPPDSLVALTTAGLLTNDEGTESYLRQRYRLPATSGPARPVAKPESAFSLPNLPVTARARERSVKAKSSGSKADTLAEADRARTHVEQVHKALLKPAWMSMVGHADLGPVLDHLVGQSGAWQNSISAGAQAESQATRRPSVHARSAANGSEAQNSTSITLTTTTDLTAPTCDGSMSQPGSPTSGTTNSQSSEVRAAADPSWQPIVAPVVVRQLQAVQSTASGQRVESIVNASILAGHAQGDVQAQLFLNASRDDGLTPLPPYDARAAIDGWWNDTLGATSRRVAQALSDALDEADTLDRAGLLDVMLSELEDTVDAEFFLDDAMSWSLSQGAMDRYSASGVSQVEFLTAEDSRVDEPCSDAEAGNPWSLGSAPTPPLHANCLIGSTAVVVPGSVANRLPSRPALVAVGAGGDSRSLPTAAVTEPEGDFGRRNLRAAAVREYVGDVITIRTAAGHELTGTPNHPIATSRGWVALGELQVGDDVLHSTRTEWVKASIDPDVNDAPPSIQQVAESFPVLLGPVPTAAEDFHGDGAGSQVHVVRTDGFLRSDAVSAGTQAGDQSPFGGAAIAAASALVGTRSLDLLSLGDDAVTGSSMRGGSESFASGSVSVGHAQVHGGTSPTDLNVPFGEPKSDYPAVDTEGFCERLLAFASDVAASDLVAVDRTPYSGHVYNLDTVDGWYIGNGIVTHNCRCAIAPVT